MLKLVGFNRWLMLCKQSCYNRNVSLIIISDAPNVYVANQRWQAMQMIVKDDYLDKSKSNASAASVVNVCICSEHHHSEQIVIASVIVKMHATHSIFPIAWLCVCVCVCVLMGVVE